MEDVYHKGAALKLEPFTMQDDDYEDMDAHTWNMICLHLSQEGLLYLLSFDSPIKSWNGLEDMYDKKFIHIYLPLHHDEANLN